MVVDDDVLTVCPRSIGWRSPLPSSFHSRVFSLFWKLPRIFLLLRPAEFMRDTYCCTLFLKTVKKRGSWVSPTTDTAAAAAAAAVVVVVVVFVIVVVVVVVAAAAAAAAAARCAVLAGACESLTARSVLPPSASSHARASCAIRRGMKIIFSLYTLTLSLSRVLYEWNASLNKAHAPSSLITFYFSRLLILLFFLKVVFVRFFGVLHFLFTTLSLLLFINSFFFSFCICFGF